MDSTNTSAATTTAAQAMAPAWEMALQANFGSVQAWRDDLLRRVQAAGTAGAAQAMLCFDAQTGALVNAVVAPAAALTQGLEPLLTLNPHDLATLQTSLANIDWAAVYERYQHAVHEASAGLAASADVAARSTLIDVRRAGVFEAAKTMLPDATWRDPATVAEWSKELPPQAPVLVYCVYGHEVGRVTAMRLKAAGVNARFLEGGIDEWAKAGRPVLARL